MLAKVVQIIDVVVGHQVAIVKEQSIDTQTVGQLQVVQNVPVILQIDTNLVILYTRSRL